MVVLQRVLIAWSIVNSLTPCMFASKLLSSSSSVHRILKLLILKIKFKIFTLIVSKLRSYVISNHSGN